LRRANARDRRLIARLTGLTHAGVNALNRITGVKKITEATVEQLQPPARQSRHMAPLGVGPARGVTRQRRTAVIQYRVVGVGGVVKRALTR
jgi:hypothetical protein